MKHGAVEAEGGGPGGVVWCLQYRVRGGEGLDEGLDIFCGEEVGVDIWEAAPVKGFGREAVGAGWQGDAWVWCGGLGLGLGLGRGRRTPPSSFEELHRRRLYDEACEGG